MQVFHIHRKQNRIECAFETKQARVCFRKKTDSSVLSKQNRLECAFETKQARVCFRNKTGLSVLS